MKKLHKRYLVLLLAAFFIMEGCTFGLNSPEGEADPGEETVVKESEAVTKESMSPKEYVLRDKEVLFDEDDETSVVTMYLTVRQGNAAEHTDHTWKEINTYSKYYFEDNQIPQYAVEGILQVGDENGPLQGELGYKLEVPNSIIKVRGQTSSLREQKNYKIELKDGKGTWRDQRTINLNKHVGDGLRFRNKLAYDLMKEVPQMIAARTQFVHLYVKDETEGGEGVFEDYGLYTQVEQLNKKFLANHGLDKNGQLYKINFFEFYRYEDVIKLSTDPTYDKTAFEKQVEIKGDEDHTKFIQMLQDVNDYSIPIEKTVDKWFDAENICYWMGFHILIGNVDTQSRNYFLYSPTNLNRFYFLSWDNDDSLMLKENEILSWSDHGSWQSGLSNYWGAVLFQRMFKNGDYRQQLKDAIEDLKTNYLTEEKIRQMVNGYREAVKPYVYQMPDMMYARLTEEEYDIVANAVSEEISSNYNNFYESLEKPQPFFIGLPHKEAGQLQFDWENAYDFDSENITYTFTLGRDYTFEEPIYREENVVVPGIKLEMLPPGQYFINVEAKNESGYVQQAFDYYVIDSGKVYGTKCFYVLEDGSVIEDIYDEGS
nr:CotH kinase family protein [uncultured Eisenbergiella sp.]